MNLKVSKETETGLNTEFVNMDTGTCAPEKLYQGDGINIDS